MLVLRRKAGEGIVLAGVINISVLAVEGERVKIGISAPPDVAIVREELLRTTAAAASSVDPMTPPDVLEARSPTDANHQGKDREGGR